MGKEKKFDPNEKMRKDYEEHKKMYYEQVGDSSMSGSFSSKAELVGFCNDAVVEYSPLVNLKVGSVLVSKSYKVPITHPVVVVKIIETPVFVPELRAIPDIIIAYKQRETGEIENMICESRLFEEWDGETIETELHVQDFIDFKSWRKRILQEQAKRMQQLQN